MIRQRFVNLIYLFCIVTVYTKFGYSLVDLTQFGPDINEDEEIKKEEQIDSSTKKEEIKKVDNQEVANKDGVR